MAESGHNENKLFGHIFSAISILSNFSSNSVLYRRNRLNNERI